MVIDLGHLLGAGSSLSNPPVQRAGIKPAAAITQKVVTIPEPPHAKAGEPRGGVRRG